MKKILFALCCFVSSMLSAQGTVVFQVRIPNDPCNFGIADSVDVTGNWPSAVGRQGNWGDAGAAMRMTHLGNNLYGITVTNVPNGSYVATFRYWVGQNVTWESLQYRSFSLSNNTPVTTVGPYCFGTTDAQCIINNTCVAVTFNVDMRAVSAAGVAVPDTVHVAGSFQGWNPATNHMTDPDGDGIFTSVTPIRMPDRAYNYKFVNGNAWGLDEAIPCGCADNGNRLLTLSANQSSVVMPPLAFGSCGVASTIQSNVLFSLDMSSQLVDANGVKLRIFKPFPVLYDMTADISGDIWQTTVNLPFGDYVYDFVNGTDENYLGTSCPCICEYFPGDRRRSIKVDAAAMVLPLAIFDDCITTPPTHPQSCASGAVANGLVYYDLNANGIRDAGERLVAGVPIMVSPNRWTSISDSTYGFLLKLDSLPATNLIQPGALPHRSFVPSSYNITTTGAGLQSQSIEFGMQSPPNLTDLVTSVSGWFVRPGFLTSVNAIVGNVGTNDQTNASVAIEIPNGFSVLLSSPPGAVITGNIVTWTGQNISMLGQQRYWLQLQVPINIAHSTSVTYTVVATPSSTDFTPSDNIAQELREVRGSYDPNDKSVSRDRIPTNYNPNNEDLLYTIRFQNTGTDTAFTVVVRDTLDLDRVDFSTFRVVGASHTLSTNVREQGVVEFVFNNILLPDTFVNEPGSHGFVQFRIKPKAGLPLGDQINNRAFIYFDFNAPIITNYATTTIGLLSISSAELGFGTLSLYPVPARERLSIKFISEHDGEVRYRLFDINGRLLLEKHSNAVTGENLEDMNLAGVPSGMFILQIVGEKGSISQKLIKE